MRITLSERTSQMLHKVAQQEKMDADGLVMCWCICSLPLDELKAFKKTVEEAAADA